MKPRATTLAASVLLLVAGCSGPAAVEAESPVPAYSPAVAAAIPTRPSGGVVFAPVPAAARGDGVDLPPIPIPDGYIPAAEADALAEEGDPLPGPVFAEVEGGGGEHGFLAEPPDDPFEEVVIEEIPYEETIDIGGETVEIGTPVLIVQGTSSWAYGRFPVVRSSRRFDPCFTPPRGASWAPVDYDPCWSPCTDPAWGTWNRVDGVRDPRGHVGIEVVADHHPAPRAPKPHSDPVVRQDPPAAPPPAPAPAPVSRFTRVVPAVHEEPAEPAPQTSRRATAGRSRGPAPAAVRSDPPSWYTPPARAPAPAPEPAVEERTSAVRRARPTPEARPDPPDPAPAARTERVQVRERPEPAAAPARQERRVEPPRPEPVREPAQGRNGGRDRTPEVQAPPPPPPPPPQPPEQHDRGGSGRHR